MKAKRKPVDVLLAAAVLLAMFGIAYGVVSLFEGAPEPGEMTIRSGEVVIDTATQVIAETENGETVETGARFDIKAQAAAFPVVEMVSDLYLTPSIDPMGETMYYTMYDEALNELYYRSEFFTYPEAPGTYYVVVEAYWGTSDHYFTTQHGFAFHMTEPRTDSH